MLPFFGLVFGINKSTIIIILKGCKMKSREKRIKSGNQLEVEIYPVTEHGHRHDRKRKLSRPEQQALNEKNAVKTFIRLVNTNFVSGDIIITLE